MLVSVIIADFIFQTRIENLEKENKTLSEALREKETEIKIIKREREEQFTFKMELTLENNRFKVLH